MLALDIKLANTEALIGQPRTARDDLNRTYSDR